jgi:GntR family transcriptional regulator, transcriptional repressor for pyruvate dehydrogenase complex
MVVEPVRSGGAGTADVGPEVGDSFLVIEQQTVATGAINQIRKRILSGTFQPGQKLPAEAELARQLGVSRPTLREALFALVTLGVLEKRHGSGTYVSTLGSEMLALPVSLVLEINSKALRDLAELRLILEVGASQLAAQRIDENSILRLFVLLETERGCVDDIETFVEADIEFHHIIHQASGNPIVLAVMDSLNAIGRQSRMVTAGHSRVRRSTLREHRAICEALRSHDGLAAASAMREHLVHVSKFLT